MAKLLFSTLVGSRAFGLDSPESDFDVRGVYLTTLADLSSPFEVLVPRPPHTASSVDFYATDFKKFVALLLKGDINAWVTLMSPLAESGYVNQMALRDLALTHLLDWKALKARALKMVHAGLGAVSRQPTEDASWKLMQLGLRSVIFAHNMDADRPYNPCDLGEYGDRLYRLRIAQDKTDLTAILQELAVFKSEWPKEPSTNAIIDVFLLRFYTTKLEQL